MKKILTSLLILGAALLTACGDKKKAPANEPTPFEQHMTGEDSTQVAQLIDRFFEQAKNGQYYDAAGMLYSIDPADPYGEPQPLDNDRLGKAVSLLQSITVEDYSIEYMKFSESYDNEVMCLVIMARAEGNRPAITTKMFFKPVNYLGGWCLTMANSDTGDRTIVDAGKRDSLRREYSRKTGR